LGRYGISQSDVGKGGFSSGNISSGGFATPRSNRGNDSATIIEGFITSIWFGANRFLHTKVTRHDLALNKIFGWKRVPGQDTYKRFFSKFTQAYSTRPIRIETGIKSKTTRMILLTLVSCKNILSAI
jgi:hypothetical protein